MKPSRHRRGAQFEYVLGNPAGALPPGVVISRADMLRRGGREDEADAHLRKTVTQHPASAVGLLAALRAAGRPADVGALLDTIAAMELEVGVRVAGVLSVSRDFDDLDALLDRLERRGLPELAAAAVACDVASSAEDPVSQANPLMARLLIRPPYEIAAAVRDLRRTDRANEVDDLLTVYCRAPGPAVQQAVAELARQGLRAEAANLLRRHALAASPQDAGESFSALVRNWPSAADFLAGVLAGRPDSAQVLAALDSADPRSFPGELIGRLSHQQIATLCGELSAQNGMAALDTVLMWCARQDDAATLRVMLHDAGLHALAYRLAERMDELTGTFDQPA